MATPVPPSAAAQSSDGSEMPPVELLPSISPEPEQIPDPSEKESVKKRKHEKLISHIKNTEIEQPFILLGLKSVADWDDRLSRLKKYLEPRIDEESRSALEKVTMAERKALSILDPIEKETQRILDEENSSYIAILRLQGGEEAEDVRIRAENLKGYIGSKINRHQGAEKACQIIDRAVSDWKAEFSMDTDQENNRLIPDNETRELYNRASRAIHQMIQKFDTDDEIDKEIEAINQEIEDHNKFTVPEDRIDELLIQEVDILEIIRPGKDDFDHLVNTFSEPEQARLEAINQKLIDYNQKHFYPMDWVIHLPKPDVILPKPEIRLPKPDIRLPKPNTLLEQMLGSEPVSTTIDVDCPQGSTLDGEKIIRYIEYFAPSEEERKKGKEPRYSFLIWDKTGRYYLKTGKEVGDTARRAYLKQDETKKIKITQYYGEIRHGVQYSKQYFNRLIKLQMETKTAHLQFLGAGRTGPMTKSGRVMPQEYCVIWIDDPDLNLAWYDVFRRSTWVYFFGNDANRRFDQYWKERHEEPSRRLELIDDRKSKRSSLQASQADEKPLMKPKYNFNSKEPQSNESTETKVNNLIQNINSLQSEMEKITKMMGALMATRGMQQV